MESRWYLFPGQTVENTKISDRSHALHIVKNEWNKITGHLDRKKLRQEALEKEERWKKYLKDGSMKMTAEWESSLENMRKRKEERRLQQIAQKSDDRMQKYFELKKEQDKVRKQFTDNARKKIFQSTGHPKEVTSAFIFSEVLYEREKQKEFKKFLDDHRRKEEDGFARIVKENAEKEVEEKKLEKEEQAKKFKIYGKSLKKTIAENNDKRKQYKENKVKKEVLDNITAAKEMECLETQEKELQLKHKQELLADYLKRQEYAKQRKTYLGMEEKELNDVIEIYQVAKHNIDCLKKKKEQEAREEKAARRDAVAKLVSVEAENKEEEENRVLQKAIAEREAAEEAKILAKIEKIEKARQERLEDRKKYLERQQIECDKNEEMRKWEMINQYKTSEVMRNYDEKRKRENWNHILKYRKELLDQIAEREEELTKEKELDQLLSKISFEEVDRKFFEYANETLELARAKGRPTYPIEKVIEHYKEEFKLTTDESGKIKPKQMVKKFKKCNCKCNSKR